MVKTDSGLFGIRILGYLIGVLGTLWGLFVLFGSTGLGLTIIIASLVIGRFLVWKSQISRHKHFFG